MTIEDIFIRIVLFATALLGASFIARQLIRESLFRRVLKKRSFAIDKSWYSWTKYGFGTAATNELVWGETSRNMLKEGELRYLIFGIRAASVGLYLGFAGVGISFLWFTWATKYR